MQTIEFLLSLLFLLLIISSINGEMKDSSFKREYAYVLLEDTWRALYLTHSTDEINIETQRKLEEIKRLTGLSFGFEEEDVGTEEYYEKKIICSQKIITKKDKTEEVHFCLYSSNF